MAKPKKSTDPPPPRSIIVKFLDFAVKDAILRQAWAQKMIYKGEQIYFDHDYLPELQKKKSEVRKVIKSLKQKDIKARCIYPAQLKMFLDMGEKTFAKPCQRSKSLTSTPRLRNVKRWKGWRGLHGGAQRGERKGLLRCRHARICVPSLLRMND